MDNANIVATFSGTYMGYLMGFVGGCRVSALLALGAVVPLVGCGGGGSEGGGAPSQGFPIVAAKQIPPSSNTFQIGPGASWLPDPYGNAYNESLVSVDLALLNNGQPIPAGRVLEVRAAGQFYFNSALGLSSGAAGLLVDGKGLALAPGLGSTVVPALGSSGCTQTVTNDTIPEDFAIPGDVVATLVVPAGGASAMRLSVQDCFYSDNSVYSADPIRISITLRPA